MAALSSGHLATDLAQGSLPALLPFLKTEFDLSYTMASALVLAATISSSLIQPAFGLWSDARGALWLLPAGVALAGVGMAAAAAAPSYPLILLAVLAAGIGVAAYHPEGSKFASYASGSRRASGMSFFSVGGNIGFALGPVYASALILTLGLKGGLLIALPGLAVATGLLFMLRYLNTFAPAESPRQQRAAAKTETRGLVLLLVVVGLRSVAHMGLFTFIPLWEIHNGHGEAYGTSCSPSSSSPARWERSSAALWPTASGDVPCFAGALWSRRRSSSCMSWSAGRWACSRLRSRVPP